jgi:hypothetical protein
MKRLMFTTLMLVVMAATFAGCESASRFCLRNRGASCDPCAPPCTTDCGPTYDSYVTPGIAYPSGVPLETTPIPSDATIIPGQ